MTPDPPAVNSKPWAKTLDETIGANRRPALRGAAVGRRRGCHLIESEDDAELEDLRTLATERDVPADPSGDGTAAGVAGRFLAQRPGSMINRIVAGARVWGAAAVWCHPDCRAGRLKGCGHFVS